MTQIQKKFVLIIGSLSLLALGSLIGAIAIGNNTTIIQGGLQSPFQHQNINGSVNVGLPSNASGTLSAYQESFRAVAKASLPVVVQVEVSKKATKGGQGSNNPFKFFFNDQELPNNQDDLAQQGFGSGIIIDQKNDQVFVMTNNHVVSGADTFVIRTSDQAEHKAELVGADANRDIAVLKFPSSEKLPIAELGDSTKTQVGDIVFAIGSPYGIQNTITQGIISAVGRSSKDFKLTGGMGNGFTDYIQTDASINQGNSGGALVNIEGQVIGVNTWIATRTGGSVGLGFAVPINNAKKVAFDLITKGKAEYGWLGVSGVELPEIDKRNLGLQGKDGAFVGSIIWDSPAFKSGIKPGDLITSFDGDNLSSATDLVRAVSSREPNKSYKVVLLRNGASQTITVTLGLRNDADIKKFGTWPGFGVSSVTESMQKQLKGNVAVNQVVITAVDEDSAASEIGLKEGVVITSINGQAVKNLSDFYKALGSSTKKEIEIKVINRNGREVTLKYEP